MHIWMPLRASDVAFQSAFCILIQKESSNLERGNFMQKHLYKIHPSREPLLG